MSPRSAPDAAEAALRAAADDLYTATATPPRLAGDVLRRERRRRNRRRRVAAGGGVAVVAAASTAAVLVGGGPYYEYTQPSAAMMPTVPVGAGVVVDRDLAPARGDVVQLTLRVDGRSFPGLSRVVGLGGDVVACPPTPDRPGSCLVTVDGVATTDPYLAGLATAPFPAMAVPQGRIFVLGDARDAANDSRLLGPVDLDDVHGVAVAVIGDDGRARPVPGAPRHRIPDDYDVDPAAPVPPAGVGGVSG